jgi:hypothetical protein
MNRGGPLAGDRRVSSCGQGHYPVDTALGQGMEGPVEAAAEFGATAARPADPGPLGG